MPTENLIMDFELCNGKVDKQTFYKIRCMCLKLYNVVEDMGKFAKCEKESFKDNGDEEYAQYLCMKSLMFCNCLLNTLESHKTQVNNVLEALDGILEKQKDETSSSNLCGHPNENAFSIEDILDDASGSRSDVECNEKKYKLSLKRTGEEIHTQDSFLDDIKSPIVNGPSNAETNESVVKLDIEPMEISYENGAPPLEEDKPVALTNCIEITENDMCLQEDNKNELINNNVEPCDKKDTQDTTMAPLAPQNIKMFKKLKKPAIEVLQSLDYSTESDWSSSDTSSDSESNVQVTNKITPTEENIIIERNVLLSLSEDESRSYKYKTDVDDDYITKFNLMECSVTLRNIDDLLENFYENESDNAKEMREIKKLTNLSSILHSRKRILTRENETKRKKLRTKEQLGSREDESSSSDLNDRSNATTVIDPILDDQEWFLPKVSHDLSTEDVLKNILLQSSFDQDVKCISDTDSDEKNEKTQKSKPKNDYVRSEKVENNVDENIKKMTKWRDDKLLRGKLPSLSSSDEDEPKQILHQELTKPKRRKRANLKRKDEDKSMNSDSGSLIKLSSDSSDVSSDVEFVKSEKLPKSTEIDLVNDCIEDDDLIFVKDKKKGRKNIRAVQSDKDLAEATRKAVKEEEERSQRLLSNERRSSTVLSQSCDTERGLVLDIHDKTNKPTIVVNKYLTSRLKKHQREGVRFMWNTCYESVNYMRTHEGSGCILAHCMGLGKTFQVITLIHTLFTHPVTHTKHVLVVCPLSVVLNWVNEFDIALNGLKENVKINKYYISDSYKSRSKRLEVITMWRRNTGVLIMGYDTYMSMTKYHNESVPNSECALISEALIDPGPDLVICDEGHLLKNGDNSRTQALMRIRTKRRIILTGTPMQNNLKEYYFMVQFVRPNLLGTPKEYANRFINPIMNGQYDDSTSLDLNLMRKRSHVLHKLLQGVVQRYEFSELQTYLPEKEDYVLFIPLHPVQIELYSTYTDTARKTPRLFSDFHYLRYLCTHPYLLYLKDNKTVHKKSKEVDAVYLEPAVVENNVLPVGWWKEKVPEDFDSNFTYGPKLKVMQGIIEECEKINDKLLIFSSSMLVLDAIEYVLKNFGTASHSKWVPKEDYLRMDGNVAPDLRTKYCHWFNNPNEKKLRLLIISSMVGGLGLNLVGANRVILMDANFNPAYESQSVFRLYRFGQNKRCYVYRLVSMGTMEEVVYERSVTKLAISARVIDELQISRHYKSADLQKMYRFNVYTDKLRPVTERPGDDLLATILERFEKEVFYYHEHQSLLVNCPEEELDDSEQKLAWDEYKRENYEQMHEPEKPEAHKPPSESTKYTIIPCKLLNNNEASEILKTVPFQKNSTANTINVSQLIKKDNKLFIKMQAKTKSVPLKNSTNVVDVEKDASSSKPNKGIYFSKIVPNVRLQYDHDEDTLDDTGNTFFESVEKANVDLTERTPNSSSDVISNPLDLELISVTENVIEID